MQCDFYHIQTGLTRLILIKNQYKVKLVDRAKLPGPQAGGFKIVFYL